MMKTAIEITNEENPFLREVWAMGYDDIVMIYASDKLLLVRNDDKYIKEIPLMEFQRYIYDCEVKTGILHCDCGVHYWIRESNGDADKFRELIRPENENSTD